MLSVKCLFQLLNNWAKKGRENRFFRMTVSYLEIYNECVNDLLNSENKNLDIQKDSKNSCVISNLTEVEVEDAYQVIEWLNTGESIRKVAATYYNETSSRSHTVFRIRLQMISEEENQKTVR